jgi:hypothetical protein
MPPGSLTRDSLGRLEHDPRCPELQQFRGSLSWVRVSQMAALSSTRSAAASNARATDLACLVVRYSSWSAETHSPDPPLLFCTAATSAENPRPLAEAASAARSGGSVRSLPLDAWWGTWGKLWRSCLRSAATLARRRTGAAPGSGTATVLKQSLPRSTRTVAPQLPSTVSVQASTHLPITGNDSQSCGANVASTSKRRLRRRSSEASGPWPVPRTAPSPSSRVPQTHFPIVSLGFQRPAGWAIRSFFPHSPDSRSRWHLPS